MASWLVLDWDQDQFHILQAQSSRTGLQVTRAATWAHPEPLTPSTAESVGKALREFLKAQKIAAAPVIVGLGRDRVFLKELRIPPIAAHEEASLVRFQTGKEMADSIDHYAVDYAHLNSAGGERHIMTVAGRRELVALTQTLCQGAGLKLHAITPRLFGIPDALEHALAPEASPLTKNRLSAVLNLGQRWAELSFFRGRRLLQAQALANGAALTSEVKRNLAVFQAQHAVDVDVEGPDCLYVFGAEPAVESLRAGQPLPIKELDPLKGSATNLPSGAAFAGAVGLALLWSTAGPAPVNLATPKRQKAPTSVTRRSLFIGGAAAAVLLVVVIGAMVVSISQQNTRKAELLAKQKEYRDELAFHAQERADLDAYREWEQNSVRWLDEMYDLSARYPFETTGFRVNQFTATTPGVKKNAKEKYVGNILLQGVTPSGGEHLVNDLFSSMTRDPHLRPHRGQANAAGNYSMNIEVLKQQAKKFDTVLAVPKSGKAAPPILPPPDEPKLTEAEKRLAEPIGMPEEKTLDAPGADEKGGGK